MLDIIAPPVSCGGTRLALAAVTDQGCWVRLIPIEALVPAAVQGGLQWAREGMTPGDGCGSGPVGDSPAGIPVEPYGDSGANCMPAAGWRERTAILNVL
ncbi:exported hypothetical protein [Nitrolancea hollandica Lb]|uniref:Uncharacterized protein n=1 Tax=Nitrolancea hollandica Lb TaxID=1129897 RepID=I4EF92_9BACT|nr:exported hypothetical protein [Nitrolancea hollandica Lb]